MTRHKKAKVSRSAKRASTHKKENFKSIADTPENVAKALFGIKAGRK